MGSNAFAACHPAVNLAYFVVVLGGTMALDHPVLLCISLLGALLYAGKLLGGRALSRQLVWLAPVGVVTMAVNPLFNHRGATILAWLPDGNPLTLESFYYGAAAAVMLWAAVLWFLCVNRVLTAEKFVWLFGRFLPALALVLTMTLRFVPRFTRRLGEVTAARKGAGYGGKKRFGGALSALSITVTWALESAIHTSDSMRSRGYGLPGRTAFSLYRWEKRDTALLCAVLYGGLYVLAGSLLGGVRWQYSPVAGGEVYSLYTISIYIVYLGLCLMPVLLERREEAKWNSSSCGA